MKASEIIEDVVHRVGVSVLRENGPKFILRAINRVYHQLNRELLCLTRKTTFNSFTDTVNYVDRPSDLIQFFAMDPAYDYVDLQDFMLASTDQKIFTFKGDKIYFYNVDSSTSIEAWYYSTGYEIVDKDTPATGETNVPEWVEEDLHQILVYGTALDLSPDYPFRQRDEALFFKLKARLSEVKDFSHTTPKIIGGAVKIYQTNDPYGLT
ncbi:MAG: hypothetical protein GXO75_08245 [Calditrichaeota bacterium]|nr:hypothetical protein [Calditrichota bacterium]